MNKTSFLTAAVAMASMVVPPVAHAETNPDAAVLTPKTSSAGRDFHIGINFRTDFGARYYRADLGVRLGKWDAILVVDPLGIPKSDYDFDALLRRRVGDAWSIWGGARLSMTPIARSHQFTEKLLVGVSAELPSFSDKVRIHSGLELAVHLAAHGADIMTRWVCVDSPACREDHFVFGLFGRVEYASAL